METREFSLPPFRFEVATDTLWHGRRARRLRPRAAALLEYLVERPGQVISAEEILAALWPGIQVEPGVVKVYVWEIRQALREHRQRPRFLETVPKRGYRWIGDVARLAPGAAAGGPRPLLVGRAPELGLLRQKLALAEHGERQVVLVTGEPGIGKSALVQDFVRHAGDEPRRTTVTGQCIAHSGPGEAYLPVLSALGEVARGPRRRQVVAVLARHAPTWLVQLPDALAGADRAAVEAAAHGASRERMLRELADALEHLTQRRALVLVLEDLQWSDASTLELIALVARRTARARLLLVATFRPGDVAAGDHPLPALHGELSLHGRCTTLPLAFLAVDDVAQYARARLGALVPGALDALAAAIHERTEGNPLFMVEVVEQLCAEAGAPAALDDLVARVRRSVPASVAQAIEARIARLPDTDQELLEAASAAGGEFSAAALAAALEQPLEDTERRCAGLVRGAAVLELRGEERLPDGTIGARFAFVHALYQSVLDARLTPARRRTLHRRIADRLEAAYGARAGEIAAALALHCTQASEPERAIAHLETAASNALAKHANAEAARHLSQAIGLLATLPDGPERARRELVLQVRLGAPLLMSRGYAAPEVQAAYGRALELCRTVGESVEQLLALAGIYRFSLIRAELRTAHDIGNQVLGFARRSGIPLAFQIGHLLLGITSFGLGALEPARDHLAVAVAMGEGGVPALSSAAFGDDPLVVALAHTAMTTWFLGAPDQSLARCDEALVHARAGGLPQGLVFALNYATWCRLLRHEAEAARALADELLTTAREADLAYWIAQGTAVRGWVAVEEGRLEAGIEEIRRGLDAYEAIGAEVMRPWHLVRLAEAYGRLGRVDDARATVAEAFATMRRRDERFYEAELHRVDGELRLAAGDVHGATDALHAALATARRQGATALALRAATSLVRATARNGGGDAARATLGELLAGFREGLATGDLRAARAVLQGDA